MPNFPLKGAHYAGSREKMSADHRFVTVRRFGIYGHANIRTKKGLLHAGKKGCSSR
jgi:hypothetical protein